MEREIGDKFMCDGVMLEVVGHHFCDDCWLYHHRKAHDFDSGSGCIKKYGEITGTCHADGRKDGKFVIFKKVTVMHIDIMNG